MKTIELVDLTFAYPRGPRALAGVSGSLEHRVTAVLGPNGAGKSTLLKILTLQLDPSGGRLVVGGHDLSTSRGRDRYRRTLGVMPQHLEVLGGYTCAEFLRYAAWMREVPVRVIEDRVAESLRLVGLVDRASSRISTLSGGMRQRLGLAQALVNRPELLVLDEPTVGLDPRQRAELRERVAGLGSRVVLATHLVDDVAALAEGVLLVADGRLLFNGSLEAFCGTACPRTEDVERAYLDHVGPAEAVR